MVRSGFFLAAIAVGCGSSGNGYNLLAGSDEAGGGSFPGDDASVSGTALDAHIQGAGDP